MSAAEIIHITEELKAIGLSLNTLTGRFDALEDKVDKHNGLIDRMYAVESKLDKLCTDHCRIQNEKEKKKINWSAILQTIISGVTVGLLLYLITR